MKSNIFDILNTIAQAIYDKKGFNILALDVKGLSSITDYVIIAEGSVDRHVKAIADTVIDEMKKQNERPIYTEGMKEPDWVVLDYMNIMVHIFKPDYRIKYDIEKLFPDSKIIDLNIKVEPQVENI